MKRDWLTANAICNTTKTPIQTVGHKQIDLTQHSNF